MLPLITAVLIVTIALLGFLSIKYLKLQKHLDADLDKLSFLLSGTSESAIENTFHFSKAKKIGNGLSLLLENYKELQQTKRQFTESASHELQTPLAIIKGNAELLLQSPTLREVDYEALDTMLSQIKRVSKLNEALILLTRIENSSFSQKESLSIIECIQDQLSLFTPLINNKKLIINQDYKAGPNISINQALLEMLIGNLLKNAIKYNITRGYIHLKLDENTLTITNSGYPLLLPAAQMFLRFQRDGNFQEEEGLGLGLSIVKRICKFYGHKITYENDAGTHSLIWTFK